MSDAPTAPKDSGSPIAPAPTVSDPDASAPSCRAEGVRLACSTARGAGLGMLLLLGLLGVCILWQSTRYEGFTGWAGLQGQKFLQKPGYVKLRNRMGDSYEYAFPVIRSWSVLASLAVVGLAAGALVGFLAGFAPLSIRRFGRLGILVTAALGLFLGMLFGGRLGLSLYDRNETSYALEGEPETKPTGEKFSPGEKAVAWKEHRARVVRGVMGSWKKYVLLCGFLGAAAGAAFAARQGFCPPDPLAAKDAPRLPWTVPLGLAVVGVFFHGCLWGNVALWLQPYAWRRRLTTALTWCVAGFAVIFWAWGLETDWGDGWSKQIPGWLHDLFYSVGNRLGMKE